jgi:hypothetical protein
MNEEQLMRLIDQHGGLVSNTQERRIDQVTMQQDPTAPWRLLMADGTWILVTITDDTASPQPIQAGMGFEFPPLYTVLDSGREGGIFSQADSSPDVRQGPDGNWYQWDGSGWVAAPGMPTESTQTNKYREFGGNLYIEDPTAPNGLRLVMEKPASAGAQRAPRYPEEEELDRLQVQKARQDLMSPYVLQQQQVDEAIESIRSQIASGRLSPQEADKQIQLLRLNQIAGLQGTTPFAMETQKQNLASNVLDRQLSAGSGMATSLLSGAGNIYGNILAGHGTPTNFNPLMMAKLFTQEMGGGPELSNLARSILTGALGGSETSAAPGSGDYLPPQMRMPRTGGL